MKSNKVTDFDRAWNNNFELETIEGVDFSSAIKALDPFAYCNKLKNITFEGEIPLSLSFRYCPLTVDSMKSIITHLKNYTGLTDSSGNSLEKKYTLTLKNAPCRTELESAEFTDEDISILAEKGIIITDGTTWISVIDDLKWNLVWA